MTKSNEEKSLSKTIKLHGVEIKKMPCGKYFEALQTLKDLPEDFIKELSSEGDFELSEMLTVENMMNLVAKLMIVAPKFLFSFLSKILDVDEVILKDKLTPIELLEVCKEFWKVNKLESFFDQMKPVMKGIITLIGFKGQLPYVSK